MKNIKYIITLLILLITSSNVNGDIVWIPNFKYRPPDGNPRNVKITRDLKYQFFQLKEALVDVHIGASDNSRMLAEVECSFFLVNKYETDEDSHLAIGMPVVAFADMRYTRVLSFQAGVDGQKVQKIEQCEWGIDWGNEEKARSIIGYFWVIPLKGQREMRVNAKYRLSLYPKDKNATFEYFLRSGAMWSGNIEKEIVRVIIDKGIKAEVISPEKLSPSVKTDQEIIWKLQDIDPQEDILIKISRLN